MLVEPCACRLSREAAMTCPRESRGELIWSPLDGGLGPAEVVTLDGAREKLAVGSVAGEGWVHYGEGLARQWASVLHLDFKVADRVG